jgi:nicotinamide mononucleotide transporter
LNLLDAAIAYALSNWLQLLGAVLGLIQIWLLVRRSVWNFPVAMVMVSLIGVTLFEAKLYAEAALQAFFFVVNAAGWFQWRGASEGTGGVPVRWMNRSSRMAWAAITALLSLALGWLMHRFTDAAVPFVDAAVAGASIAAQLLLNLRRIENWVLWIVIDVVSILLYLSRDLYFFAALYLAFLVISAIGLRQWIAAERDKTPA